MRGRRRPLDEGNRRHLVARGGSLAALAQHPSWPDLEDEVKRKEDKLRKLVLSKAMSPQQALDQREVDYIRGFIGGLNWLVAVPSGAEQRLEHYLREHGVEIQEGEAS